jgi:dienelactone hydrolase
VLAWQANLSPFAGAAAIPSGEATVKSLLFKPVGPGPILAAVGLHGCGGLDPVDACARARPA